MTAQLLILLNGAALLLVFVLTGCYRRWDSRQHHRRE